MKRIFTIVLFSCFLVFHCVAGTSRQNGEDKLLSAYNELARNNSSQAQTAYFNAFPDTWPEFILLESMTNSHEDVDILQLVDAFARLTAINDTVYCIKLMNLCIGASLDADGTNFLHRLLHDKMGDSVHSRFIQADLSHVMLWLLSHVLKGKVISFWNFYWSSLCFEEDGGAGNDDGFNEDYYRLRAIMQEECPDMITPMTIAYEYFHNGVGFISDLYTPRYFNVRGD